MPHRPVPAKICSACPFCRVAIAGWLGRAEPEGFIVSILREEPLPCHPTINYETKTWEARWRAGKIGEMCRGALTLQANIGKQPRNNAIPVVGPDTKLVFASAQEFINHHRSSRVRSWED